MMTLFPCVCFDWLFEPLPFFSSFLESSMVNRLYLLATHADDVIINSIFDMPICEALVFPGLTYIILFEYYELGQLLTVYVNILYYSYYIYNYIYMMYQVCWHRKVCIWVCFFFLSSHKKGVFSPIVNVTNGRLEASVFTVFRVFIIDFEFVCVSV